MFASERQQQILERLARAGRVEVSDLAQALQVSDDTVRRDLNALAARGVLHKTHGGAVSLDPGRMGWAEREDLRAAGKAGIGRAAAALVEPGQSIVLDAGSTVLQLARQLTMRPLTVLTNSLDIAQLFASDAEVQLSLTGGDWHVAGRLFTGAAALDAIARRRADWAFLGACAFHAEAGITSVSEADSLVKRAMLQSALRGAVLADGSKAGQIAPYAVCGFERLSAFVTDDAASAQAMAPRVRVVWGGEGRGPALAERAS